MKKLINRVLLSFIVGSILFACKTGDKKKVSAEKIDTLKVEYQAINDTLDTAWSQMIQDDDEKLANAKRLLQEVSYTNTYDKPKYQKLMDQIEELESIRYSRESMANSQSIDAYDSASSEVMFNVMTFATSHPQYENYPLMKELVKDIQDAQTRILLMRVHYDHAAKDYNRFIEENKEVLHKIDSNASVQKKPLFELSS